MRTLLVIGEFPSNFVQTFIRMQRLHAYDLRLILKQNELINVETSEICGIENALAHEVLILVRQGQDRIKRGILYFYCTILKIMKYYTRG